MNAMTSQKTWGIFFFGLFFAIAGTLILFSLMVHFEAAVNPSEDDEDEENHEDDDEEKARYKVSSSHEAEQLADLEAIIANLHSELDVKKTEIQQLAQENFNLRHKVEEIEEKLAEEAVPEEEVHETFPKVKDARSIEEHLYVRSNTIEVTRL